MTKGFFTWSKTIFFIEEGYDQGVIHLVKGPFLHGGGYVQGVLLLVKGTFLHPVINIHWMISSGNPVIGVSRPEGHVDLTPFV